jgi:hypothetical protein
VQCPKCRLVNPPSARRCDCGWDLTSPAPPPPSKQRFNVRRDAVGLAFIVVVGGGIVGWLFYYYFYLQFPSGHFCRSNSDCHGQCLLSAGVCTNACDDDDDCPSEMKCGEATSRTISRGGIKSDPHVVNVCVPR